MNRRDFIKLGAAATGGLALSSGLAGRVWAQSYPRLDPGTDGDQVIPSFCGMCFWKCGLLAHVKDGKVTKLQGNPAHPLSNGHLCPRGVGGLGLLYDPDRLKKPLLRRGKRGGQRFEEVEWSEALDFVAEKMLAIKSKYGPEALALFSHGHGGWPFKTLVRGYGSESISAPSFAQCRGARSAGFDFTYGSIIGSPERTDIENARVITLIGSHLGENMHNTQVQELARAIDKGAELVVVDPRFSTAAGKARYWLPIKPGTDIALLLGWMHVIVNEGLYNHDYVEKYAIGFDELQRHLEGKTPEWAFAQTTIPAHTIRETARFIAGAAPASLVHPGRHTAWYGDDTQRLRAIAILDALLGAWGHRGGLYYPSSLPLPAYPLPPFEGEPRRSPDTPKGTIYPYASEEGLAHGLRDASIPGTAEYDVKGWFVYSTNLPRSLPQPEKTREAIQHLDLLVAVDVLPMEITGWADVVLPEASYLERWDDVASIAFKRPFLAVRQQVVPPVGDSKPGWWIAKELGKRLGLEKYFPWKDAREMVTARLQAGGYDVDAIFETGVHVGAPQPTTIEEGLTPSFGTPSGKIELYSKRLDEMGLDPIPDYTPPEEPPPGTLRLLYGRTPTQTFTRTTNNRVLGQMFAENHVWLNAKVAKEKGLKQGEYVTLVNQDGVRSNKVRVKVTQRIRPDCVYLVHGYGHTERGLHFGYERGASDALLMSKVAIDPIMGGTGMRVSFVSVERWQA